jgi:hypothetical protein
MLNLYSSKEEWMNTSTEELLVAGKVLTISQEDQHNVLYKPLCAALDRIEILMNFVEECLHKQEQSGVWLTPEVEVISHE